MDGFCASCHYSSKSSSQKYAATPSCFCNVLSLLEKTYKFLNQTVTLSCFPCKQYTSSIYVKEKSFCLVNRAFPFMDPRGPFSCSKVGKIFYAYEG